MGAYGGRGVAVRKATELPAPPAYGRPSAEQWSAEWAQTVRERPRGGTSACVGVWTHRSKRPLGLECWAANSRRELSPLSRQVVYGLLTADFLKVMAASIALRKTKGQIRRDKSETRIAFGGEADSFRRKRQDSQIKSGMDRERSPLNPCSSFFAKAVICAVDNFAAAALSARTRKENAKSMQLCSLVSHVV